MNNKKDRAAFGRQLKREQKINDHRAWRREHLATQAGQCYFCHGKLANTAATCKKCNKEHS